MLKNINSCAPVIGLLVVLISLAFIFSTSSSYYYSPGREMGDSSRKIYSLVLFIPLMIMYLISIGRVIGNPKVFDESPYWTFIHIVPIIFILLYSLSFLETNIKSNRVKKKQEILKVYKPIFTDKKHKHLYLIRKQNIIYNVVNWGRVNGISPPYLGAIGKINNDVFESIYTKEELLTIQVNLENMINWKEETIFQVYKYHHVDYDKDAYKDPNDYYPKFFND